MSDITSVNRTAFLFSDTMSTKRCSSCGCEKPLSDFSTKVIRARKDIRDGYNSTCLDCDNQYHQSRRRANPEPYYAKDAKYQRTHSDNRKANGHRRRARIIGSGGGYTPAELTAIRAAQTDKRGRLICWKCGTPIIGNEPPPHMKGAAKLPPHLDHWIPLSKGGTNDAGNLHYMHGVCNLKKGTKLPVEIGRLL